MFKILCVTTITLEPKDYIALYAAAVSTFVLLWRIYEFREERKGKIKITSSIRQQATVFRNGTMGDFEPYFIATIVNVGKNKRQIEQPFVYIYPTINGQDKRYLVDMESQFPVAIEPGEKFVYYKAPFNETARLFKKEGVTKIKYAVQDTHGKVYKSPKWVNL